MEIVTANLAKTLCFAYMFEYMFLFFVLLTTDAESDLQIPVSFKGRHNLHFSA